jgi:hypothetical protein
VTIAKVSNAPWVRKHDLPSNALTAPAIAYPTSLEELIKLCRTQPRDQPMHAAGSHWGLSTAAESDHTFVETRDPTNRFSAMARTLTEVIPKCMSFGVLEMMKDRFPRTFENNLADGKAADDTPYYVHVESGKRVYELYAELDQDAGEDPNSLASLLRDTYGNPNYVGPWAFRTLGAAGGQTVFGALTTGTHGGDFVGPPIADDVVALHLVADGGRHFWLEPPLDPGAPTLTDDFKLNALYGSDTYGGPHNFKICRDPDVFHAVLVGAHRFGVVYSLVLKARRQYMMRETRVLGTWQNVRTHIASEDDWLYQDPPTNKFLQIVVCLTPFNGFQQNLVSITKRTDVQWTPPGEPRGRAQRVGQRSPNPDPLTGNSVFAKAGASFAIVVDENDPAKVGAGGFLNHACTDAAFLPGLIDEVIDEIKTFIANPSKPVPATVATVAVITGSTGLLALLGALAVVVLALAALVAELRAAAGDLRLGQTMDRVRLVLLDHPDTQTRQAGLFIWHMIAFKVFTGMEGKNDQTAISYAILDTHNYLDQSCMVNVDSIEVFFEADNPMLVAFIDALIAYEILQEYAGKAMIGYASLRFIGETAALLGPARWDRTCVVEIAGLRDTRGSTDLINYALQLSRDPQYGGILHWGQRNPSSRDDIERRFGDAAPTRPGELGRWRAALSHIANDPVAFSSQFSRQTGLEPL